NAAGAITTSASRSPSCAAADGSVPGVPGHGPVDAHPAGSEDRRRGSVAAAEGLTIMLPTRDEFWGMPWPRAAAWLMGVNVGMSLLSLAAGELAVRLCRRRVTPPPGPLQRREVLWAAACVVLNGGVAVAGWLLWQAGFLHVRRDASAWAVALD